MAQPTPIDRDGTSQAHRHQPALQPASIAVDERSLEDWLAFAHAYAKELRYYGPANSVAGDWSALLNPQGLDGAALSAWLQQAAAFADAPEAFEESPDDPLRRPHFVLFLAFLQLLRLAQGRLNRLTQRHLDFYYRDILRLVKTPPRPDRVHLLVQAAADVPRALLPAGTLLDAGKDSLGQARIYRTDQELVVNHARIERLSSVYINRRTIGIREAREQYRDRGLKAEAIIETATIAMLEMALGEPVPGAPLPLYPADQPAKVDFPFLTQLHGLVQFVGKSLYLTLAEFRSLMQLKLRRDHADDDWNTINGILEIAGKQHNGEAFTLAPSDPRDFDGNLENAVGILNFNGLPEIKNIYQLYDQRIREDAKAFIATALHLSFDQFLQMMQIKVRIDNEWSEINSLLERAGQRKRAPVAYSLALRDPTSPDFDANFAAALQQPDDPPFQFPHPISDLDGFHAALLELEAYFFMPAEDFALLMETTTKKGASAQEWDAVYAKLATAHSNKVYAARRQALRDLRPRSYDKVTQQSAWQAMLRLVLGLPASEQSDLRSRLDTYLPQGHDGALLNQAAAGDKLADEDWEKIYVTLELAWRNRIGTEPVAQRVEWLNLCAHADATSVAVPDSGDNPRWRTFGQVPCAPAASAPATTALGWMIGSPLLCLSQGQRTITLTLEFSPEQFDRGPIDTAIKANAFQVQVSTDKGWLEPDAVEATLVDYPPAGDKAAPRLKALRWTLRVDETAPPLARCADAGSHGGFPWPAVRLLLQPRPDENSEDGTYITDYPLFQRLTLEQVLLQVEVKGLTDLQMQNDEGSLAAKKPFEPFGSRPAAGARFYLGHPELAAKPLTSLTFNLQWMGLPTPKLDAHYRTYSAGIEANTSFSAKVSLMDQRTDLTLAPAATLFEPDDANQPHAIAIADVAAQIRQDRPAYVYRSDLSQPSGSDLQAWSRYLQWELNAPDFQHGSYTGVATAKSIELAAAIAGGDKDIKPAQYQVNPPYTPKLKSLSVDYTASVEIALNRYAKGGADGIFHLHPFGYAEIQNDTETGLFPFLPSYGNEGELYIGLQHTQPGQRLSLLLQMAEGSANPDLKPATVQWSYLSGNRWISLHDGQLRTDGSRGLLNSGIVQLQLDAAAPNTLLPADLYWLRIAVPQGCDSVCDTVAFHTQAVSATFIDQGNAEDHLAQPLAAETIRKPIEPLADIAAIRQPYTSFGGRPQEQDAKFNTRVSERLRHKQRALSPWDYERLVLERFPEIYKAKCLPADATAEDLGRIDIVVIPDIRNRRPFDPFKPKAPASLLSEIREFLAGHAPPFATLDVKNAVFLPVKLRFAVRFHPGCDIGYYKQQLNEDLNRFLSPWAYDKGKDVVIGGKIYANAVIDFMERRPYVEYVAQFKMFLGTEDGLEYRLVTAPAANAREAYAVDAGQPDQVLVAAQRHEIDLITDNRFVGHEFTGIDYMKVQLDFIVG